MKKLIGALAVVMPVLLAAAPGAEAKSCWWNGYDWVCKKKHRHYAKAYRPYYGPYAYYPAYRPYYRPRVYVYACVPPFCW